MSTNSTKNAQRTPNGTFTSTVDDKTLWGLFREDPSTTHLVKTLAAQGITLSKSTVRSRLAKIRREWGVVVKSADPDRAGKMEQLVASIPLKGPNGSMLSEAAVGLYGVAAKDEITQEINVQGLDTIRAKYRFDRSLATQIVTRETKLAPYRTAGNAPTNAERIFIVGDQQIGFWAVLDPKDSKKINFLPFHDERAIDVMLQAMAAYQPHRVVIVGDFLDYPQLSKFQQEPEFAQTLQASVQEAYELLRVIRKTVGAKCRIDFVPGNHEKRMERAIVDKNSGLHNLTRPGEKWPVYSVPALLHFDELGVECANEYPSGEVWLASQTGNIPGLVVTHANPGRNELRADAIYGHLVLPKIETRQVFYQDGPVTYTAMCVSGCGNYSDTQDRLRLTRTATPSGRARMQAAQSFATVEIDKRTKLRHYGLHLINNGRVNFLRQVFTSRLKPTAV